MGLMMRIGPQSVTMDMVARECGISKRTLYETFPNKRALLSSVIKHSHEIYNEQFKEIFDTADNSFEALMKAYHLVRSIIRQTSPVFMTDLQRLYPEIFNEYRWHEKQHVKALAGVIRRAQDEGLVLPGINCYIASLLFNTTMKNIKEIEYRDFEGFNITQIFDGAFLNFMRGMATERGQALVENFVRDYLKNEY